VVAVVKELRVVVVLVVSELLQACL